MPWRLSLSLFVCFLCLSAGSSAQQHSILAQGRWFKIGVPKSGVYKLTASYLQNKGIVPTGADPRHVQIRGYGGGMLPEPNATPRPQDLPELAIQVVGQEDGRLDAADHVLFYAEGPDRLHFNQVSGWFDYQKNLYSDSAYYFVGVGQQPGLRVQSLPNEGLAHPAITSHEAVTVYEKDEVSIITSGRRWFGDGFGYTPSRNYSTTLQELAEGPVRLRTAFVNTNESPVSFTVSLNEQAVQTVAIQAVDDYQYANKGWIREQESLIPANAIAGTAPLQLKISLTGSTTVNKAFLDYYLLQAPVRLRYRGNQLPFVAPQSTSQPTVTYKIADAPAGVQVWDISSPAQPLHQQATAQGGQLQFGAASSSLRSFISFEPATAPEPAFFGQVTAQNLHADLSPELLIITHPSLLAEAERLAAFRRSHDGLSVKVATTQQVYNEFSSGRQDVVAIRDYTRYLYQEGSQRLRYLLLFGRGYYDYKQRTTRAYNLVPVYESYNSTHPVDSYASDDFYGFLEAHEGDWTESESGNQSLEIGIGRLPLATPAEARQVVDKLIHYSTSTATLGKWRQRILFVADDDDGNGHQLAAERLSDIAATEEQLYSMRKIFVDAYPKAITPNSQTSPGAQAAIGDAIRQGALIVNYSGHGSPDFWAQERIFSKSIAERLDNKDRLPLFVTATCEFGLHDGAIRSGAETLLLNPNGGAIGLLTTARPVYSSDNFTINSAFYRNVFPEKAGDVLRLGDVIRKTKNEGVPGSKVNNRNFVLLGDPSLQLAYPKQPAVLTAVVAGTGAVATDTLSAYERIRMTGAVLKADSTLDSNFSGTLLATVYDKSEELSTLGQTDPPMLYTERQNVLFRGEASVVEGAFTFELVVPKNIRYEPGAGRIEMYAVHQDGSRDAAGATEALQIGGSAAVIGSDTTPPQIELYLNDTTFASGNPVAEQATLIARLQDESGINISFSGLAQNIEAVVDDTATYVLNDYYTSELDSYKKGWVRFPLLNLKPGNHRLRLQAWDTYGNMNTQELLFVVPGGNRISISRAYNFPNPFREQTTFAVTHNRSGDDLEVEILLFNTNGQVLRQQKQQFSSALGTLYLPFAGAENKIIAPGLYLYKVILRSLSDGSVAEKSEKLVILY